MISRRRAWRAAALLAGTLLLCACDRSGGRAADRLPPDGPSVLLITLDTTRADRLGCYGHKAARTPALDGLAAGGVRFEQAFCQVPLTLPSHASLLTGAYPPTTGVRVNGAAALGPALPTLAEAFQSRGYRTGAFVSAWVLDAAFGLSRGFDHYDDALGAGPDGSGVAQERPADAVYEAAGAWLDGQPDRPFFAWVHFFDPHAPYEPPSPFDDELTDPYDGEIAFMDTQIRRLLERVASIGGGQTLIVAVGDHGEAFLEHGETGHGVFVYDVTMRVPLIFAQPRRLPAGHVVTAGVEIVAVAATILDLMGWEPASQMAGISLRSVMEGGEIDYQPAYGESEYPYVGFGWSPLKCCITRRWKYILAPRPELYDRLADPGETVNVIADHGEVAADLRGALDELVAGMAEGEAAPVALDADGMRALESLGYVGARQARAGAGPQADLRDPKDMLGVLRGLERARELLQRDEHAEAVDVLEPLVAQSPESDELRATLGAAYLKLGRYAEAEREILASLRGTPGDPHRLCWLGDALYGQGKVAEAVQCYEQAVAAFADHAPAHNKLGVIFMRQDDVTRAYQHVERYAQLNPTSAVAHLNMATVEGRLGRWARVLPPLTAALRHARTRGQAKTVAQLAQQCCRNLPPAAAQFDLLARAQAAAGDFEAAIPAAERARTLAEQQGQRALAGEIDERLRAYRAGRAQ